MFRLLSFNTSQTVPSSLLARTVPPLDKGGVISGSWQLGIKIINNNSSNNNKKKKKKTVLRNKHADWFKIVFLKLDGHTELHVARDVDVMIARARRIYISIIQDNKLFSFFSSRYFLKEIENMYSVFLSSYRHRDW